MITKDIREQNREDRSSNPNEIFICTVQIKLGSFELLFLFYRPEGFVLVFSPYCSFMLTATSGPPS